ncbi:MULTISPECIES: EAL domain-containing protein [Aeromonas]|uniref:EAL domain-containing protein n=1 Tax=Aeromonas TaxID=642 RepID=UPI0038D1AF1D
MTDCFRARPRSAAGGQRLPLDELKIDRSFVRNLPHSANSLAIVRSIVALSKALNLRLIAEGVEEAAQIEALVGNGCDGFQGFYFAKPLQLEAFETHLAKIQQA